jgi:energy-coupling factor transport system ATP-binding protein
VSALATLREVTVTYRTATRPAIDGVGLDVHPGELILLAGPSGCGKSTVMRVLNGLVPHAYRADVTGTVLVDGVDTATSTIRDIAETVGTLLQNPAKQVVGHSVLADIAFGLENRGVPAGQILDRVHQVADALQIGDELLGADTHELSGGQLQLVAFAGILVLRPKLIIADEPLANLDPDAADRVLLAIRRHVDDGGAAVIIEHRVADVVPVRPDRVLHLGDGTLTYSGDLAGFLRTADPAAVTLPFDTLQERAAELPAQGTVPSGPPGAALLRYAGAHLGYGDAPVLRGVNVDLPSRQRVAVLGRNGAGKSTLLRAAVGLVQVLAGEVTLAGRAIADYRAAELTALCGYLFQNPAQALFAGTVADELAFGPRNLGFDDAEIEAVSAEALHAVGLASIPGIGARVPRTLSFGEQRRLALALALTLRPRTLILDEPTAGQDERSATHFLDAIWALPGIESIYFITHDVDLALWRADRVIVVDAGELIADATPAQIVADTTLWHAEGVPATGRAVLRETGYVRAARSTSTLTEAIPPPHELARQFVRSTAAPS